MSTVRLRGALSAGLAVSAPSAWVLMAVTFWLAGLAHPLRAAGQAVFTNAMDVRNLSPTEAARGYPVHLRGVVTLYDPGWNLLFVQDASAGIYAQNLSGNRVLQAGQPVEVTGFTAAGKFKPIVNVDKLKALSEGIPPKAKVATIARLATGEEDQQWVEVAGNVRSVSEDGGRFSFELAADGRHLSVVVLTFPTEAQRRLVGANVKVRGVCVVSAGENRRLIGVRLMVPRAEDILIQQERPSDAFGLPVQFIKDLAVPTMLPSPPRRVRLRARVARLQSGGRFEARDATGQIGVKTWEKTTLPEGIWVDIVGYPKVETNHIELEDAMVRRIGVASASAPDIFENEATNGPLPQLNSASRIRQLSVTEAGRHYPVRLGGVITYYDPDWNTIFFQGETEGIFVSLPEVNKVDLRSGQRVVIYGRTALGDFAPVIVEPRFDILGLAPPPEPKRVTVDQMMTGKLDSQWIETEGVIHSISNYFGHLYLEMAAGKSHYRLIFPNFSNEPAPTDLLDAEVRVQAVCATRFNQNRQLAGIRLFVPSLASLKVIKAATADPFASPVEPILTLLQFRPTEDAAHRVHVRGVVTLQLENGNFFLQDNGARGLFVQPETRTNLAVGAQVDAAGFPEAGGYSPVLKSAQVRLNGRGQAPDPLPVTAGELLGETLIGSKSDNRLVKIEGRLIEVLPGPEERILILQADQRIFQAVMERKSGAKSLAVPGIDSVLELTGVCDIQVDEELHPRAFRIRLRSASDVRVLHQAPWWTFRHTLAALAGLLAVILMAFAWVVTLHRRVGEQTKLIWTKVEREAALEKRFEVLIEHAADAIFVHDAAGRIRMVNQSACDNLGYTREELLRLTLAEVEASEPADQPARPWEKLEPGQALNIQSIHRRKDGSQFPVEVRVGMFEAADERTYVALARDVTERQRLEAQLRQSQKMESVGQLAGGVAHDFNNLLTVIQGYASLLLDEGSASQKDLECVRQISESAERAANLTRQLLAFSRRQVLKFRAVDLNEAVVNLGKMLKRLMGEDIDLELRCFPGLPSVRADLGMMEQVIMNLAVNARDSMPKGGKVVISTKSVMVPPASTNQNPEAVTGPAVCLEVIDTGSGIAPENLPHLFEPFFTTKDVGQGTGLGLATVYGIVKQHNGWIEVLSILGRGTTFQIFLPVLSQAEEHPQGLADIGPPSRPRGTESILVVEDEEAVRGLIVRTLTREGYRIHAARNAAEAREIWRTGRKKFDLLLTDMVMPGGTNGNELAVQFQNENAGLRVLFSSGYSPASLRISTNLGKCSIFLPKPYTPSVLVKAVRDCLDQPGRTPPNPEEATASSTRSAEKQFTLS